MHHFSINADVELRSPMALDLHGERLHLYFSSLRVSDVLGSADLVDTTCLVINPAIIVSEGSADAARPLPAVVFTGVVSQWTRYTFRARIDPRKQWPPVVDALCTLDYRSPHASDELDLAEGDIVRVSGRLTSMPGNKPCIILHDVRTGGVSPCLGHCLLDVPGLPASAGTTFCDWVYYNGLAHGKPFGPKQPPARVVPASELPVPPSAHAATARPVANDEISVPRLTPVPATPRSVSDDFMSTATTVGSDVALDCDARPAAKHDSAELLSKAIAGMEMSLVSLLARARKFGAPETPASTFLSPAPLSPLRHVASPSPGFAFADEPFTSPGDAQQHAACASMPSALLSEVISVPDIGPHPRRPAHPGKRYASPHSSRRAAPHKRSVQGRLALAPSSPSI
ncbi:hypothetical protein AURDEDRAFT_130410 [Auricularia subglabra TFB-10046 SS5]|uniref:Uncharacterized protein n=1 Tax=Auricularia subglabra (strain TFB-10046 / SS5) TaxID=717982 RepID=J0LF73_AURST|nr:hypothetical protein AURDEDRAFT_130410 [Auricularia subglabra TFB-10046 SS5]